MKITSIIKLIILFVLFYYIVTFIQVNQQDYVVNFPWLTEPLAVSGPAWAVMSIGLAAGFLGSALWVGVQALINFFSPKGRLSRSMKKVEEKYYYGIEALSKGDNEAAGLFFEEILNIDPDNFRTLVKYGELLRKTGKSQRAISLHQQALTLSQNNVKILHELSLDYMAAGENARAREMLEKIIEISPKGNIGIHRQLRDILVAEKDWVNALRVQRNIIAMVSDAREKKQESQLLHGLEYEEALVLKEEEKYEEAAANLQAIINKDRNFLPAHLELGECQLLQGLDTEAAATWWNGFEETESPVLLTRLENFFLNIEMPDKAIETYNNAINAHEDAILPKLLLGKLFYRLEMVDRAISIFEEIDSEFEYAPVLFYFMGKIQMRKGQDSEAAETFKEVLRTSGILDAEYKCGNCGEEYSEYLPQCKKCFQWNTLALNVKKDKALTEATTLPARPVYQ